MLVNIYKQGENGERILLFESVPNGGSIDASLLNPGDVLTVDIIELTDPRDSLYSLAIASNKHQGGTDAGSTQILRTSSRRGSESSQPSIRPGRGWLSLLPMRLS